MNLITLFQQGLSGHNVGLSSGIPPLDKMINGIQRAKVYGVAAAPKCGKSTLVDFAFVLMVYLLNPTANIQWFYFSYEMDRVTKEFKFAAFFFFYDYNLQFFEHNGKTLPIDENYLQGKLKDEVTGEFIKVTEEHQAIFMEIYEKRIVPLFGRYDEQGNRTEKGKIYFIEERDNPTGMRNLLLKYAEANGTYNTENYTVIENGQPVVKQKHAGYVPNDPEKYTIVITDTIRKLRRERNYSMKENIDKWIEYSVEFRNKYKFTFVHIVHLNRNVSAIDRVKFINEYLYPNGDDVKDTGNLSEEVNYLLTMFNPNDEKYGIKKHFGLELMDNRGRLLHPQYRSIHLVESRDTPAPAHLQVNMFGNINFFTKVNIPDSP